MTGRTRSIAVLMLVGMLLQVNCVFVYYGLFFLNQKAIAETCCEKKTTDCCGHCFLQKKIASANETTSATSGKRTSTRTLEEQLNPMPGLLPDFQHPPLTISTGYRFISGRVPFLSDGILLRIDHPPNA